MIKYQDIKGVHLELSSNCNASCPLCPRNFHGYPNNDGYPVTDLSLENIKHIFSENFIQQLGYININGNFGDFMLAKDALAIVAYFRQSNPYISIHISTNAGARNIGFWQELAQYGPMVRFCIDGLDDTHSLYRRDTSFDTVIRNASAFIQAGGHAIWKMIEFEHNRHQVEDCRARSKELGFNSFILINHGRDTSPVFDREGNLIYKIGNPSWPPAPHTDYIQWKKNSFDNKDHWREPIRSNIQCVTKIRSEIYVASNGEVYPCCWTGFYPRTYGHNVGHNGNDQLKELLNGVENNALLRPLEDCIKWFNQVEQSWQKDSFESGRLYVCNHFCGK